MFGIGKSAEIARLESELAGMTKAYRTELATNDALDRTAKKFRQERDDARLALTATENQLAAANTKLQPFLARKRGDGGRFVKVNGTARASNAI